MDETARDRSGDPSHPDERPDRFAAGKGRHSLHDVPDAEAVYRDFGTTWSTLRTTILVVSAVLAVAAATIVLLVVW